MPFDKYILKKVPIFSDLTDRELQIVADSGMCRTFPSKCMIFQEGEPGEHLLIILSGKVKILLSGKDGKEVILSILGGSEFFGEMAILDYSPRCASVVTMEPSKFFLLSRGDLGNLLKQYPAIAIKFIKNLSQRLRKTNDLVRNLVMFDIYGRIGNCLLTLAGKEGGHVSKQLLITNRPSFQEIAKMVGCSRETLSRAIKILKDNGCLTITRNTILINKGWE